MTISTNNNCKLLCWHSNDIGLFYNTCDKNMTQGLAFQAKVF